MTSHQLFHNLLVTSKSKALAHTQGDGISQGHEHQEIGIMRAITEVTYQTGVGQNGLVWRPKVERPSKRLSDRPKGK